MTQEPEATERIQDIDLQDEMQDSFLEYSYSVIYARALPDARDGLKPVQRRIVYQMGEMGLRPDRGHVKSARVTGEVMGKLHPHGDSAIYDALVRMSQTFSLRVPLIDGHGNFGSLDDGPAAARYTEARLTAASMLMNQDLDEDVVDFRPNYDAQLSEPEVLPAAFPNLLVNGASGIAVGMATNMAPHNLREVVNAAIHLLNNPQCSIDDLMQHVPGPDLPTGGIIVGLDGVREAYETGRGSFKTRARVSIESVSPRKQGIVVTELPYLVGPEKVIEKIRQENNISDLRRLRIGQKISISSMSRKKSKGSLGLGHKPELSNKKMAKSVVSIPDPAQSFTLEKPVIPVLRDSDITANVRQMWGEIVPQQRAPQNPPAKNSGRVSISFDPMRYPTLTAMDGSRILVDAGS